MYAVYTGIEDGAATFSQYDEGGVVTQFTMLPEDVPEETENDGQSAGNPQQNTVVELDREQSEDSRHSRTENRDRDYSIDFGR
jgi:hypothetical protein